LCLILTTLFLVLSIQSAINKEWPFTLLYSALSIFFIFLIVNNIKALLKRKDGCSSGGCTFFDLFKRADKQKDDRDLG